MSIQVYDGRVLVESWDDATRTYTDHRLPMEAGINPRPYTAEENARADAEAQAASRAANEEALRAGLADVITAALARQAEVQTVIGATNSAINGSPASYIKTVARAAKRQDRALIRLARLAGNLLDSADTGSD